MTREQIEELRRATSGDDIADAESWVLWQHKDALLAAAERALVLEDVFEAAQRWVRLHSLSITHGERERIWANLVTAIDRAEWTKP